MTSVRDISKGHQQMSGFLHVGPAKSHIPVVSQASQAPVVQ